MSAVGLLLGVAAAVAVPGGPAAASGQKYFVDCSAGADSNSGTHPAHPWRTLSRVNAVTLGAGDNVGLKAGTTCTGTLAPRGSGTEANPVVLRTYDTGAPARIAAQGARAGIFLHNVQGYAIRNLDVTNTGPAPSATQQRVGIYVLLEDYGIGAGYAISNVTVHDVNGCDCRYPSASGGIVFEAGGSTVPTGFRGIAVGNNTVTRVDRSGIAMFSSWQRRSANPTGPGSTFVPMTEVSISQNTLKDIGGDGILVLNGVSARVGENVVDGFNTRSTDFNVGVFAWNSDDTVFQHNQVLNGKGVGIAYALEAANFGTVYQYNFSRNNGGGFLYVCASDGSTSADNVVRYNISANDGGPSPFLGLFTLPCVPQENTQVYNNVFYAPTSPALVQNTGGVKMQMTNNIFAGQPSGSVINDPYSLYDHDMFHRVSTLPTHQTNSQLADPMFIAPDTALTATTAGGLALRAGSPALATGIWVPCAGGQDYFGSPLPSSGINIGAYQGPGV